jgi:sensor histidine kinase regulating citrate/malate metabolism
MTNEQLQKLLKDLQDKNTNLESRIKELEKPKFPDKTTFSGVEHKEQLRVDKLYDKNGKLLLSGTPYTQPTTPTGGSVIDIQARATIVQIITILTNLGLTN